MAPRNDEKKNLEPAATNSIANSDELDLAEVMSVNESLDELSSALDFIEQRTDNIMAQLKELLCSNREIRESIAKENQNIEPKKMDE